MANILLAGIPFERALHLKVRSLSTGTIGKVTAVHLDPRYQTNDLDGQLTTITWENGNTSVQRHYLLDKVEILDSLNKRS